MNRLSLAGAFLLLGSVLLAQSPKSIVVKDQDPNETWAEEPSTLLALPGDLELIPQMPGGRAGKVWIRKSSRGLAIVGAVDGGLPEFPRNKNHILEADHIEVWIAFVEDVPLPPIGYGNQFGAVTVASEKGCEKRYDDRPADEHYKEKCTKWYQQQVKYRTRFKKLFARQWLITDYYHEESFATPAYGQIVRDFASDQPQYGVEIPAVLKPVETPLLTAYLQPYGGHPGYRFAINIPWESMPPVNSLEISHLRLLVEAYSSAPAGRKYGPYSSTAPGRKYGKPETFNLLTLETSHKLKLSPCGGSLEVKNKYDERVPGWLLPAGGQQPWITTIFGITNEALGYMYEPDGLSPIAFTKKFFFKQAGPEEWVCGPEFKYRTGSQVEDYGTEIHEEGMDVRKLADGRLLVKEGPLDIYRTFGSGQCGGCPTRYLAIYAIGMERKLTQLLEFNEFLADQADGEDVRYKVSPDWSRITYYESARTEDAAEDWRSTLYCLGPVKYERCGQQDHVTPPDASPAQGER